MKIAFLLGSPDISGGTYVIFQHALALQYCGHEVAIVTDEVVTPERIAWHPEARHLRFGNFDEFRGDIFDVALATWWKTAYWLDKVEAHTYGYFVQAIESQFYHEHDVSTRMWVDATYTLPLPVITEATWMFRHFTEEVGRSTWLAPNGIRKDIYRTDGHVESPRRNGRLRVLIEGRLGVFFKNVERTIELCRRSAADEVWLLTSAPGVTSYPGVDRVFSCAPIERTAEIYRSCDAIVKLSYAEGMFGPPLEMFHCGGTAIAYDVSGHEEYLKDGVNGFVVARDDERAVIERIAQLRDGEVLARLKRNALETAAGWPSWEQSSRQFDRCLHDLVRKAKHREIEQPIRSDLTHRVKHLGKWFEAHHAVERQVESLELAVTTLERNRNGSTAALPPTVTAPISAIGSDESLRLRSALAETERRLQELETRHAQVLNSRSFRACQSARNVVRSILPSRFMLARR